MGLAGAPATESIMGSLPPERANIGSAVNDTTRELGGALLGALIAWRHLPAVARTDTPEEPVSISGSPVRL